MRNLKALGLALVAVFALSAIAASAAQAEYNLTPGVTPSFITAEQIAHANGNKLEIPARGTKVECKEVLYKSGTLTGLNLTDVNVTPEYKNCTANGELAATVDVNGCSITLTGETSGEQGVVHLLCSAGKTIEITIPAISCTLKIHEQTPTAGGVKYTNTEASKPDDVDATAEVSGVTYERVGTSTGCVAAAQKEGNDATLLTNITVKAFEDTGGAEGKQVNLTVT